MPREATALRKLRIAHVSAVDKGAGEGVHVKLLKRADDDTTDDTEDQTVPLLKRILAKLSKREDDTMRIKARKMEQGDMGAEGGADMMGAILAKLTDEERAYLEAELMKMEGEDEDAEKGEDEEKAEKRYAGLPEDVRKQLTTQAEEIRKLRDERDLEQEIRKAASYDAAPMSAAKIGKLLHRIAKAAPDAADDLRGLLRAMNAAISKSALFEEAGHTGDDSDEGDSAEAQVNKRAAEIAKAQGVDIREARLMACDEDPKLKKAYRAEVRKRARARAAIH